MDTKALREKNSEELNTALFNLLREQFELRMAKSQDALKKNHRVREVRRSIARIKTIMAEKQG